MNITAVNENILSRKDKSPGMFDLIHKRYDLLNHLFSFGLDVTWRYRLSRHIEKKDDQQLLDLASGTGDAALSLLKHSPYIKHAVGCDMAGKMLETAQNKAIKKKLAGKISFLQGDAANIPFANNVFDVVTMAFGIRNMVDPAEVLSEILRVLKKGGKTLILEFSLPTNPVLRNLHLFYLRHIIPWVGGAISRDKHAYRYLDRSIETFPYGESFCRIMEGAGFRDVRFNPLTFGVATLYQGEK
jgi:demethylmenaquinone methyltransferase/2-methoxy-6-polyprenyl-1,4-benzoquinol methylase